MTATTIDTMIRVAAWAVPLAVLVALLACRGPQLRTRGAALLAAVAVLAGLVPLNVIAARAGWWTFTDAPTSLLGQPLDLLLAWAVLWGAIPTLLGGWRWSRILAVLAGIDLLAMPLIPGVELGSSWGVGEIVGLTAVAAPAILLGRLTAQRRHLRVRAAMQLGMVAVVFAAVGPLAAAGLGADLALRAGVIGWIGGQVVVAGAVIAIAGVWELYDRGQGTPWPWDPPRRLVTTGPYRYVRNPMQLGGTVVLLGEAVLLGSWWLAAMAGVGALFAATSAAVHEHATLGRRAGAAWRHHQKHVRAWWPSWRPAAKVNDATLWIAGSCSTCAEIAGWLRRRQPAGLHLRDAEAHPGGPPRRATYEAADGHVSVGMDAIAHALEHVHAGWALTGAVLRLPGVRTAATIIADAVGFGPQQLVPTSPQEQATCPSTRATD